MRLVIAAAVIAFIPCQSVLAWSLSPTGSDFTLSGGLSFSGGGVGIDCKAVFAGATNANGVGQITAASFFGGMLSICSRIHPLNLPWAVTAADARNAVISSISVRAPFFGDCAARDIPVTLPKPGAIHVGEVDLPPHCAIVGGDLRSTPAVSITR